MLQEVKVWAEQIMRDSQAGSGYHTDIVHDEVPMNPSLISLPQFVSYSETKDELPDGRHRIQWFLLDTAGHNHLAVVGIEKETRDGHYIYSTENIFEKAAPLQAHNQEEVKRWLSWIIGPRNDPLTPHFFSSYRSKSKSKSKSKKKSHLSQLKSREVDHHALGDLVLSLGGLLKEAEGTTELMTWTLMLTLSQQQN